MAGIAENIADDQDELALVLHAFLDLTDGWAIGLVAHASDDTSLNLLCVEKLDGNSGNGAADLILEELTTRRRRNDSENSWTKTSADSRTPILQISLPPVKGHEQLSAYILFHAMDPAREQRVNEAYECRKAILLAYFRLWQTERLRRRQSKSLQAALDLTQIGVILIQQSGDIGFANNAADEILAKRDGLRRIDNALRATDLSEGVRLQVALNHVAASSRDGGLAEGKDAAAILALHRKNGPPLIVSLVASDILGSEPTDITIIAFVVDPQNDTAAMLEPVCRLYQLSTVETQLVSHLAQGRTVAEASDIMRIKEQTARSYMKQIFIKTDTNRQTELVVLLLSSVVRMKSGQAQKALGGADLFAPRSLLRA